MITKKCEFCDKNKEYKFKSHVKRFCSYKCKSQVCKRTSNKLFINCSFCKQSFSIQQGQLNSRINQGDIPKFCSRKCSGLSKRKRRNIKCRFCNKEFETNSIRRVYCSIDCSNKGHVKFETLKRKGFWFENGYKILSIGNGKGIKEHRYIMEKYIGRKLLSDEHIHHINGIKTDNRLENLEILSRSDHIKKHRKMDILNGKLLFGKENNKGKEI